VVRQNCSGCSRRCVYATSHFHSLAKAFLIPTCRKSHQHNYLFQFLILRTVVNFKKLGSHAITCYDVCRNNLRQHRLLKHTFANVSFDTRSVTVNRSI